jgi:uncharacterized cupredoxin-like copper-binding protein
MDVETQEPTRASTERTLLAIERRLEEQVEETRSLRKNAFFFGGIIVLVSLVSLVAVTAKLGTKDIHVTTTTVAKAPAATAPAAAATGAASATTGGLPSATSVTLKEFKVTPTQNKLAAGKVIFKVHNAGTVTHEFVVLKTTHPSGKLPLYKGRADEAGNVGETGDLKAGASKNLTLILAPGHYALICNLPGHYLAGQHTDLVVQ